MLNEKYIGITPILAKTLPSFFKLNERNYLLVDKEFYNSRLEYLIYQMRTQNEKKYAKEILACLRERLLLMPTMTNDATSRAACSEIDYYLDKAINFEDNTIYLQIITSFMILKIGVLIRTGKATKQNFLFLQRVSCANCIVDISIACLPLLHNRSHDFVTTLIDGNIKKLRKTERGALNHKTVQALWGVFAHVCNNEEQFYLLKILLIELKSVYFIRKQNFLIAIEGLLKNRELLKFFALHILEKILCTGLLLQINYNPNAVSIFAKHSSNRFINQDTVINELLISLKLNLTRIDTLIFLESLSKNIPEIFDVCDASVNVFFNLLNNESLNSPEKTIVLQLLKNLANFYPQFNGRLFEYTENLLCNLNENNIKTLGLFPEIIYDFQAKKALNLLLSLLFPANCYDQIRFGCVSNELKKQVLSLIIKLVNNNHFVFPEKKNPYFKNPVDSLIGLLLLESRYIQESVSASLKVFASKHDDLFSFFNMQHLLSRLKPQDTFILPVLAILIEKNLEFRALIKRQHLDTSFDIYKNPPFSSYELIDDMLMSLVKNVAHLFLPQDIVPLLQTLNTQENKFNRSLEILLLLSLHKSNYFTRSILTDMATGIKNLFQKSWDATYLTHVIEISLQSSLFKTDDLAQIYIHELNNESSIMQEIAIFAVTKILLTFSSNLSSLQQENYINAIAEKLQGNNKYIRAVAFNALYRLREFPIVTTIFMSIDNQYNALVKPQNRNFQIQSEAIMLDTVGDAIFYNSEPVENINFTCSSTNTDALEVLSASSGACNINFFKPVIRRAHSNIEHIKNEEFAFVAL